MRFPQALQEKDFVVPGEGFISHDGRRNLTDLQETSQWLGGVSVAKGILEGLLGTSSIYLALLCFHPSYFRCDVSRPFALFGFFLLWMIS